MNSIMIVAAEASSALYAQRLLEYWKKNGVQVSAFGVGTQEMENLGFERFGHAEDMAIVGAAEIIAHYSFLKSIFNKLVEQASKKRPSVVVLMDYPEFNLMLAKEMHKLGIPTVYYISPQVWAWRKGRVKTIKKYCDKVFLLFPFEQKFYEEHGVPNEFVGHPILDELDAKLTEPEQVKLRRRQCGISDNEIVIGIMPGSRRSELKQHFSIQLDVARKLIKKHNQVKLLIMVAPTFEKEQLYPYLENFGLPYIMIKDEPFKMISLADYVLVASGTATLMVGLLGKPMVIMYRMSWLTSLMAKVLVRGYFGLVNLILGREVVPERFQEQANSDHLADLMDRFIVDEEYTRQVKSELSELIKHLGDHGATKRVADSLQGYFKK